MKTTLDLPFDVAATLRRESARRGGRSKAPMKALIAEAVRKTYGRKGSLASARITARLGTVWSRCHAASRSQVKK